MKTKVTLTNQGVYTHYSDDLDADTAGFVKEPHSVLSHISPEDQPVITGPDAEQNRSAMESILHQQPNGHIYIDISLLKDLIDHLHIATGGQGIFRLDTFKWRTSVGINVGLRFIESERGKEPIAAALMPVYMEPTQ